MIYAFDLDNTLCHTTGMEYNNSKPNYKAITRLNKLYDEGHTIKIFTARGTVSKIDFKDLTEKQLKAWGIKYHELILGKPAYDVLVDDKAMNASDWVVRNMVVSRTPLRISFLGGGTDYPGWYLKHGGAVIATSIDKYCHVSLYQGKQPVWHFDLPSKAGLGTSSALTVGLLRVYNISIGKEDLAQWATIWEQDKLSGNIGAQDQYTCSVGGFHLLRFSETGIRSFDFSDIDWLNPYLMLFNTHQYRMAGMVVANQIKEISRHTKVYERMMDLVDEGKVALDRKDAQGFGVLLDESWILKRQLSRYISNPTIDDIYAKAKLAGAIGGKLLGAGGGGFMLFLAPLDKQEAVKQSLGNCEHVPFQFDNTGTQVGEVIYKDRL